MLQHIEHIFQTEPPPKEEELRVVSLIRELFSLIDVDGDGTMDWEVSVFKSLYLPTDKYLYSFDLTIISTFHELLLFFFFLYKQKSGTHCVCCSSWFNGDR